MSGPEVLLAEGVGRAAVLTLNRPEVGNTVSLELLSALRGALLDADSDDAIDVIVLTGSDPAFCLGLDLAELASPARRALEGAGLTTLAKLARKSEAQVRALHGMGPNAMATLRAALRKGGRSFAG